MLQKVKTKVANIAAINNIRQTFTLSPFCNFNETLFKPTNFAADIKYPNVIPEKSGIQKDIIYLDSGLSPE